MVGRRTVDLNTLSQFAEVLGGIAVVTAVVFGVIQLRQYQQQRRDMAAVELMRTLQDSEFTRAFHLIYSIPESLRAADIRARGTEYEAAAFTICARFETVGLLVFRRNIPSHLVEELVGGLVIKLWQRLLPWVEDIRVEQEHEILWEWYQWLAEQFDKRGRIEQAPAFEQYRDWQP